LIPLLTWLAAFFIKKEKAVKAWALFSSVATLAVSLLGLTVLNKAKYLHHEYDWLALVGQ
jgi:NADH-quinone oxidoreductase subunit M